MAKPFSYETAGSLTQPNEPLLLTRQPPISQHPAHALSLGHESCSFFTTQPWSVYIQVLLRALEVWRVGPHHNASQRGSCKPYREAYHPKVSASQGLLRKLCDQTQRLQSCTVYDNVFVSDLRRWEHDHISTSSRAMSYQSTLEIIPFICEELSRLQSSFIST